MNYLPSHYRANNVLRFTSVFQAITNQAGLGGLHEVRFKAESVGLNVSTAKARVVDAKHAVTTELVLMPGVDPNALRVLWPRFKLVVEDEWIKFVPKDQLQKPILGEIPVPTASGLLDIDLDADSPTFEMDLTALAILLQHDILMYKVFITITNDQQLDPELVKNLTLQYNRQFKLGKLPNTTYML